MKGRITTALAAMGIAVAGAIVLVSLAELVVRIVGPLPSEDPRDGRGTPPAGVRVDPLFGPRPQPAWSGSWHQGFFRVATDAHGFRTAGAASVPGEGARVALLGDSCTFGYGLDGEDTFAAGVARMARADGEPVEILNAAYPGDSAAFGPYLLSDRVLPLDPDVVVIGYSGNNAFRFALVGDVERLADARRRKWLLRSRLLALAHAVLERGRAEPPHPRDPVAVREVPIRERRRVLEPDEFEAVLRSIVELVRAHGSRPIFLLFPRASQVSARFGGEDAVVAAGLEPEPDHLEEHMLQYSCLDPRRLDDPFAAVRAAVHTWRTFYPNDDRRLQRALHSAARAYASGSLAAAQKGFERAVALDRGSPLALYDLGATSMDRGRFEAGAALLARAERSSCNVFVQYQRIIRRVAIEASVPVVDLMLAFQTRPAGPLFLDPAHPSPAARDVIAGALWPAIRRQLAAPVTARPD